MDPQKKCSQMIRQETVLENAGVSVSTAGDFANLSLKELVRRRKMTVERLAVTEALRRTEGNKSKAARLLGISYPTLRSKMRQYKIRIIVHVFSQSAA
jgi:DNA-binding NtrC family response regulator